MTNDKINWLKSRRSIRRYKAEPVPPELVEEMLTAVIQAPSAHNRQPWRLVVIHNQQTKERLAKAMGQKLRADLETDNAPENVITQDVNRSYERITQAPLLILLCLTMADMDSYTDTSRQQNEWLMAVQSTAMAGQNLLLAAHVLGLAGCWMCAPLFCQELVCQTLSLPADWQPQSLITIGYPAELKEKSRHPLASCVVYR